VPVAEVDLVPQRADLASRLRRAPLGVLLMSSLFSILGLGSAAGGAYLLLTGGAVSLWAAAIALVIAPTSLYFAYHLAGLAHWAWLALLAMVGLLFVSSVVRVAVTPGLQLHPFLEIAGEAIVAFYLLRPSIRAAFGWA
jgi:hypothetical protein